MGVEDDVSHRSFVAYQETGCMMPKSWYRHREDRQGENNPPSSTEALNTADTPPFKVMELCMPVKGHLKTSSHSFLNKNKWMWWQKKTHTGNKSQLSDQNLCSENIQTSFTACLNWSTATVFLYLSFLQIHSKHRETVFNWLILYQLYLNTLTTSPTVYS